MTNVIRVPLRDSNGNDFMTGQPVPKRKLRCIMDWEKLKQNSNQRISETQREDGKVLVSGLGWVDNFISSIQ